MGDGSRMPQRGEGADGGVGEAAGECIGWDQYKLYV